MESEYIYVSAQSKRPSQEEFFTLNIQLPPFRKKSWKSDIFAVYCSFKQGQAARVRPPFMFLMKQTSLALRGV